MRFGLALSGGGIRSAAHIGVLKALEENGLRPSWISGTSAGSIVAGLYACGYSPLEMENVVMRISKNIFDTDFMGLLSGLLQLAIRKDMGISGILKGCKVEKLLDRLTKGQMLQDAKLPLAIVAVDICNGQTVYFISHKKGLQDDPYTMYQDNIKICEAIRASIAIPVLFQPKIIGGQRLVDGGISDSLPTAILKKMGASRVVGVNLGYSGQMKRDVVNIIEIGSQSLGIMEYHMTQLMNIKADCIINPNIYDVGLLDLHKIPECIERGYIAAKKNIDIIIKTVG